MKKTKNTSGRKISARLIVFIFLRLIILLTAVASFLKGEYYTVFLCTLALFLFFLPSIIEKTFRIEAPDTLQILVLLFIFASLFLGEIRGFYEQFPHWDKMLHLTSGFLSAAIGFSLIDILNRSDKVELNLSPLFIALFAFCFSLAVGVLWEFFEFGTDSLFGFDMQKDRFISSFKSVLIGQEKITVESVVVNGEAWKGYIDIGLIDTMEDLIVGAIGAIVFSVFGWLYLHGRGRWIEHLMPKKEKKD